MSDKIDTIALMAATLGTNSDILRGGADYRELTTYLAHEAWDLYEAVLAESSKRRTNGEQQRDPKDPF